MRGRVGLTHRVLAVEVEGGLLWFWIGDHSEYDQIISRLWNDRCLDARSTASIVCTVCDVRMGQLGSHAQTNGMGVASHVGC